VPVIKSAIKKLRKDRKRERENDARRKNLESAIRQARRYPAKISAGFSALDRAVKFNIIHKNKAARIKASLSKLTGPKHSQRISPKKTSASKK
jgi:small subunit ribosomal protein S20